MIQSAPTQELQSLQCDACGQVGPECSCVANQLALHSEAVRLRTSGLAAAREAHLHEAIHLLSRAVEIGGTDAISGKVLGLAALATGDIPRAAAAWEQCLTSGEVEDVQTWLDSVRKGEIRQGLHSYNAALGEAKQGNTEQSMQHVQDTLAVLPDLIPALKLQGLLLARQGQMAEARRVWSGALQICQDDPDLLRYVGQTPAAVPAQPTNARHLRRAGIGVAWVATIVAAVALSRPPGTSEFPQPVGLTTPTEHTPTEQAVAEPIAQPPVQRSPDPQPTAFGLAEYRRGRAAMQDRAWTRAVDQLRSVLDSPEGAYYRDDALYLLAQAFEQAGKPDSARSAATRLLEQHPSSIFANSITRRIANPGTE